jgi:hypothetical protein
VDAISGFPTMFPLQWTGGYAADLNFSFCQKQKKTNGEVRCENVPMGMSQQMAAVLLLFLLLF